MRIAATGIVLVALLCAPADAARGYCQGPGRETVAETSAVRVFRITRGEQQDRVIACLKRNGRKTWLWFQTTDPDDSELDFVEPIRIKGPYVGFGAGTLGRPSYQGTWVEVIDVRTRRSLFARKELDGSRIHDLELTRAGSIAWIAQDADGRHPVRRHDAQGTATLDDGEGVDPVSLTRTQSELHWTKNGEPRSAPFR